MGDKKRPVLEWLCGILAKCPNELLICIFIRHVPKRLFLEMTQWLPVLDAAGNASGGDGNQPLFRGIGYVAQLCLFLLRCLGKREDAIALRRPVDWLKDIFRAMVPNVSTSDFPVCRAWET